jgi:hypothetical protein
MGFFGDIGDFFKKTVSTVGDGFKKVGETVYSGVIKPVYSGVVKPVFDGVVKPVVTGAVGVVGRVGGKAVSVAERIADRGMNTVDGISKVVTNPLVIGLGLLAAVVIVPPLLSKGR